MRSIRFHGKWIEVGIFGIIACVYFLFASTVRSTFYHPFFSFILFIGNFMLMVLFFYCVSRMLGSNEGYKPYILSFSYTMVPTFIWFWSNSILFTILPPPRTLSLLGKAFSIFFISYSLSLLVWKLILIYFAIRFSSKLGLYKIIYMVLLFLPIFVPYSILMYYFHIFRIPFL